MANLDCSKRVFFCIIYVGILMDGCDRRDSFIIMLVIQLFSFCASDFYP